MAAADEAQLPDVELKYAEEQLGVAQDAALRREAAKVTYDKASTVFRESAEALAEAIEVLENCYDGASFSQVPRRSRKGGQPEFGGAKGDTAHSITSVLEMAEATSPGSSRRPSRVRKKTGTPTRSSSRRTRPRCPPSRRSARTGRQR
jgi:hypothetical protein